MGGASLYIWVACPADTPATIVATILPLTLRDALAQPRLGTCIAFAAVSTRFAAGIVATRLPLALRDALAQPHITARFFISTLSAVASTFVIAAELPGTCRHTFALTGFATFLSDLAISANPAATIVPAYLVVAARLTDIRRIIDIGIRWIDDVVALRSLTDIRRTVLAYTGTSSCIFRSGLPSFRGIQLIGIFGHIDDIFPLPIRLRRNLETPHQRRRHGDVQEHDPNSPNPTHAPLLEIVRTPVAAHSIGWRCPIASKATPDGDSRNRWGEFPGSSDYWRTPTCGGSLTRSWRACPWV